MLLIGLLTIYILFLIGGSQNIKKIIKQILINYLVFNIQLNMNHIDIILLDGLIQLNDIILMSEIILIIQILIILDFYSNLTDKLQILYTNILGIIFLFESNDWILTFVCLELYNLSIYLLIGKSSSGIKYFILSSIISTILLLGIILIYNNYGVTNYEYIKILEKYTNTIQIFILLTIMFKLGLFPFHQWTPDLYDGLDTSLVVWLQIVTKYTIFIWLYLLIDIITLNWYINFISILTMLIAAILTTYQNTLKRFLAMSSISHQGFLFYICFYNNYSFLFYLFIYSFTLLTFMIFVSQTYYIYISSLFLFSLAGLPPLPGFYAKLYIIQDLIINHQIFTVIILIISSLIITANYISIIFLLLKFDSSSYKTQTNLLSILFTLLISFSIL